jgi:anti-sigma factor RsiW
MTQSTQPTGHLAPDQLNAFIDGELSSSESQGIRQHLADCPQCALVVLSATQLKAATVRARQRFAAAPEAFARLAEQLRPQEPKKTTGSTRYAPSHGPLWLQASCLQHH